MAKRKGLLFSLLYFMAGFWLTSQQVLRIGKCHIVFFFLMTFLLSINIQTATIHSLAFLMFDHMITRPGFSLELINSLSLYM